MNLSWIDIMLVGVFAFCVIQGFVKGFAQSVMSFFLVIGAILAAKVFSPGLSEYMRNSTAVYSRIKEYITEKAGNLLPGSGVMPEGGINETIPPEGVVDSSRLVNLPKALSDLLKNFTEGMNDSFGQTAEVFGGYAAGIIVNVICFLTIFLAVIIIGLVVMFILGRLTKLPVLRTFDKAAGLLVGAVKGVAFLFIISTLIYSLNVFLGVSSLSAAINNSRLIKYFYLTALFGK